MSDRDGRPPAFAVASGSDVGRHRSSNQDSVWPAPGSRAILVDQPALLIVADGMGGTTGGEVASREAVATVTAALGTAEGATAERIEAGIRAASERLRELAQADPQLSGMGTTFVLALIEGQQATVANVGDSRCYLVRGGRARQVTQDHSLVAERVRAGLLTPEQAARHPQRNIITRSLGPKPAPAVDIFEERLEPGDLLVLCSDGLFGVVRDEEIADAVSREEPAAAVDRLIALANSRGGPDNISVVVAKVPGTGEATPSPPGGGVRKPLVALAVVLLTAAAIAGVVLSRGRSGTGPSPSTPTATPPAVTQTPSPTATGTAVATTTASPAPTTTPTATPTATATTTTP